MENKTGTPQRPADSRFKSHSVPSGDSGRDTQQAVKQRGTSVVVRRSDGTPQTGDQSREKPSVPDRSKFVRHESGQQPREGKIQPQTVVQKPERTPQPKPEPVIVDSPDIDGVNDNKAKKFYFQKFAEISTLRRMLMLVFGLLFVWCIAPAFFHIRGIGVFASSAVMLCIFLTAMFWHLIDRNWTLKKAAVVVLATVIFSACVAVFGIVSGIMLKASLMAVPSGSGNYTVVVLGCKAHGDQPSWMLSDRLEKAYSVLSENPNVNCVVTGGKGDDEQYTEGYVMKKYLVEKGISPDRIYVEELSQSTQENLLYTRTLIKLNGLSENIVIVTDRFHELRARIWAEKSGFKNIYSACCETRSYLVTGYWFREMFGLARLYVFGF